MRHDGLGLDSETSTEVLPEGDTELSASVHQAEEGITTIPPVVAVGTAADLTLMT